MADLKYPHLGESHPMNNPNLSPADQGKKDRETYGYNTDRQNGESKDDYWHRTNG